VAAQALDPVAVQRVLADAALSQLSLDPVCSIGPVFRRF
jgi:hypothetical protein